MTPEHLATARLLIEVASQVFEGDDFALKGGTAINFFLRDLPRLSVDLDLVLTDYRLPREEALEVIQLRLMEAKKRLDERGLSVQPLTTKDTSETKLLVRRGEHAVKVEVNTVIRGSVHPPQKMSMNAIASETLMSELELPLLSPADIYGGKLVAAMDRQHPRDLFDVMELFAHGGITPEIRQAFVVYLVSHNRPTHEVLFPVPKDIRLAFEETFSGMTTSPVTLGQLLEARERLFQELPASLDERECEFLRTFTRGEPIWSLLDVPHLEQLPAVRWKLQHLQKLARSNPRKFQKLEEALVKGLLRAS